MWLGKAPWVGSAGIYQLFPTLRHVLNDHGSFFLANIGMRGVLGNGEQLWLSCEDLGLAILQTKEWFSYFKNLNHHGSQLSEKKNYLVWPWNGSNDILMSKL